MAWTNPLTWVTNQLVTTLQMNTHIRDNLSFLSTHTHTGAAGDGAADIGPANRLDFNDVSAPAAPGASKLRIYSVAGVLRFRAGAAGADTPIGVAISGSTPANVPLGGAGTAGAVGTASDSGHVHPQTFKGFSGEVGGSPGQTITNDTVTKAAFLTEHFDTDGMHAASATDVIIVTAGKYLITATVVWEPNTDNTNGHVFMARIVAAGVIVSRSFVRNPDPLGNNPPTNNLSTVVDLAVSDHVYLDVYQNTGSSKYVEDYPTRMSVTKIG